MAVSVTMAIAMAALPINRTSALLALWVRIQYRRSCIRSECQDVQRLYRDTRVDPPKSLRQVRFGSDCVTTWRRRKD